MARPTTLARIAIVLALTSAPVWGDEVITQFPRTTATMVDAGSGTVRLEAPGCSSTTSPGDPALPVQEVLILLPPNADLTTLNVELRDPVEEYLPRWYDVAPCPPATLGKLSSDRNTSTYESNVFYPAAYASPGRGTHLGAYLLVPLKCWPYRYNPVTKRLKHLTSARVVLSFSTIDEPSKPTDPNPSSTYKQLTKTVLNWQQESGWYARQEADKREVDVVGPSNGLLILTTSDIQKASTKLNDFIQHKKNMGFSVTVANQLAWGGGTDAVAAERIRAYLRKVHRTYRYLLIIADPRYSSRIPMKRTYPYWFDFEHTGDIPTDYYYADLNGNWDLNGNGYYGEWQRDGGLSDFGPGGIDIVPELIVGRIPYYGVPADLDKILAKTIRYETMPTIGEWAQRVLIPMKPFSKGEPSWHYGEPMKNDICLPAGLGYSRVYEEAYDLTPEPEAYPCNEDAVLAEWKKGYGYVLWGTHGGPTGASGIFSSPKCPSLSDDYPSFVFQGSCFTSHPETTDNLAYSLLLNGAIATIASTRMSGGNWGDGNIGMEYVYAKNLTARHMRCGDALWNMMLEIPMGQPVWNNHCSYVLYGDPTLSPRWPTSFSIATTSQLRPGKIGKPYGQHLFAAGSNIPYHWSTTVGDLPPGLKLDPDGYLSGTPTEAGSYTFTLQVRSSSNPAETLSREFTLTVNNPPAISATAGAQGS